VQAEVVAASRHQHLVLYDPAAIPADTPVDPDLQAQDPTLLVESAMKDLAARGEALILHIPTEDCEARLRLFVDEEPPESIQARGTVVLRGAMLKVPSGGLKAHGLEFLARPGEIRQHSQAEEAAVPAGDYSVEVRELFSWKVRHRAAAIRGASGSFERIVHRLVLIYTWLGIVLIPGNVLVAPMVVGGLWKSRGWRTGLTVAAIILAVDALVLAGFWLLQAAQKRFPSLTRVADVEAAFERENPDIAVVLRRRDIPSDGSPPAFARIHV